MDTPDFSDDGDSDTDDMKNTTELLDAAILAAIMCCSNKSVRKRRRVDDPPNIMLPPPPLRPTSLCELIELAKQSTTIVYRDCQMLGPLLPHLEELNALIGLDTIKQSIAEMVIRRLQKNSVVVPTLGHICITGGPGTGKTTIANLLAKLLASMGDCDTGQVVHFRPETAVGQFVGQTAPKVTALIKSAFGGVLLIDEVTSLSDGRSSSSGDSFSKTAIDILNRMLTEDGQKFICIVAGYADEIDRDFFSVNQGLHRRFTTTWSIDGYTPEEMCAMTYKMIATKCMTLESQCLIVPKMFIERLKNSEKPVLVNGYVSKGSLFSENAGSVDLLLDNILRCHATRVFGDVVKNILIQADVDNGLKLMRATREKLSVKGPCIESIYN
jgi:SpoVK/Ycf46/Vps4 family AAA+-type ATPase